MLVGEGVERRGEEGRGVMTIRRQAGVRRSVTSFFFFPSSSMEGAEV